MSTYDVIIIGAGVGGIFTALELIKRKPSLKILMLEKGKPLAERDHLKREDLTCGWAGAGAYSDGKIVYSLDKSYGGNLQDYIHDLNYFSALMNKVDEVFMSFKDPSDEIPVFGDDPSKIEPIKIKAAREGMTLLSGRIRHCGTDQNEKIVKAMYEFLKDKVDIKFNCVVTSFKKWKDDVFHVEASEGNYSSKYLVLMPGRSGNKWFEGIAKENNLTTINNMIDIGVRIECPSWIWKDVDSILYEPKLVIRTSGDMKVRTFCHNPLGMVVQESVKDSVTKEEIVTCNGHSNSALGEKSDNTNTCLLVSSSFTEPFNKPSDYGVSIAKLCNLLSGGGVLVQRLRDLKNGVRSTKKRMTEMNLQPTLKEAVPGDLSYALPGKQLSAILESISTLDKLVPGLDGADTILYAPEIKFYSVRAVLDNNLQTEIENLYGGGDGLGVSRGIAQSASCGLVVANSILQKV